MKIEISQINGIKMTEILSENIHIKEVQDTLYLMAESNYRGSRKNYISRKKCNSGFF